MSLILGDVTFADFELPSSISFGGGQTLAVHKLQSGARVVDALGPDDADIGWRGIISGGDATTRAQTLDQMRIDGTAIPLTWDAFNYTVVISTLHLSFSNSWWIPYEIRCVVVIDPNIPFAEIETSLFAAVNDDLASANSYFDLSTAIGAVVSGGPDGGGSTAYAVAGLAIRSAYQAISADLLVPPVLDISDIPGLVTAVGRQATLAIARGYVARAGANYTQMG